jgi:hypothetical protein
MKAIPRKTKTDIREMLPQHLHNDSGGQGDQYLLDGTRGQHHASIPAMISTAFRSTVRPDAEKENRKLNRDVLQALSDNKRLETADQSVPRFVIVWRMYPNKDNPVVKGGGPDACGCGCSCGG